MNILNTYQNEKPIYYFTNFTINFPNGKENDYKITKKKTIKIVLNYSCQDILTLFYSKKNKQIIVVRT